MIKTTLDNGIIKTIYPSIYTATGKMLSQCGDESFSVVRGYLTENETGPSIGYMAFTVYQEVTILRGHLQRVGIPPGKYPSPSDDEIFACMAMFASQGRRVLLHLEEEATIYEFPEHLWTKAPRLEHYPVELQNAIYQMRGLDV